MKSIYKYNLSQETEIKIQSNQILSVVNQNDNIVIYALIDDTIPPITYKFHIYGTGWILEKTDNKTYLGTIEQGGAFMFHVFYEVVD